MNWLRRLLLASPGVLCPNPRCKQPGFIPTLRITDPDPTNPTKERLAGHRGYCDACGCTYSVTIWGIRLHELPAMVNPPQAVDQRSPAIPTDPLGRLVGDEITPTFRGV